MPNRTPAIPEDAWFTSSFSGAGATECVEAARLTEGAAVRDSKDPCGARIGFSRSAWSDFIGALRGDRLS
ncbi:DUF397 domain-containing protein [Streptomyces sp. NPDC051018]|uniref:DUF397 domain-containing protein n=1 Tax=Streptomyces sp. NPDC051018 TaxID=3365639 RepID=UPI0037ABDDB5